MMKDIIGNEYEGLVDDVGANNDFYSTDTYTRYGGFRHKPTGAGYVLQYHSYWQIGGRVVWNAEDDTYENGETWEYSGRNNSKAEHECLVHNIKEVDDNMDNWERINFKLNGVENGQSWAKRGRCIELCHNLTVPYNVPVNLTNGEVKNEVKYVNIYYPPPWPYPQEIFKEMATEITTIAESGIRDYELESVPELLEV